MKALDKYLEALEELDESGEATAIISILHTKNGADQVQISGTPTDLTSVLIAAFMIGEEPVEVFEAAIKYYSIMKDKPSFKEKIKRLQDKNKEVNGHKE